MATLLDYALCSVADVKETMGIDAGNNSQNNLIIRKINQATLMIEGFCNLPYNHHFKETTYTNEEYFGTGTNQLVLKMSPVSSISSFQYRNTSSNEDSWSDTEGELYFNDLSAGVLDLLYTQTKNANGYRVTYTAGFDPIPADLAEACATLAAYMVENTSSGTAVKRKREGQREIEYFQSNSGGGNNSNSLIEQLGLDEMLNRYINYALADNL